MILSRFFGKPRWQSKDADARRDAVTRDDAPELLAQLGRIAREDSDAEVRLAALKRLADPGLAQGMAQGDADARVREKARALWLELMAGQHAQSPAVEDRLRLLKAQDDTALIEHLLRHAREPQMRRAALERASRPALLLERALDDSDAELRLAAVDRIADETQLTRLAERARKTDKRVVQRARERAEALRLARGDAATREHQARLLCERMERLAREVGSAEDEAALVLQWQGFTHDAAESLRQRYARAGELLAAAREPRPRPVEPVAESMATAGDEDPLATAAAAPIPTVDPAHLAEAVAAKARMQAALEEAEAEAARQRARTTERLAAIERELDALTQALDEGQIARAHAAQSALAAARRGLDATVPPALAARLTATEQRLAGFARWQQWADDQRREQLCSEIEAVPAAGLHPDAVATRVREAQQEWQRLDRLEGSAPARPSALTRRFHAACREALAPTQSYFQKRSELREAHTHHVAAIAARLHETVAALDRTALAAASKEANETLRSLDRVDPRQRTALAASLKASLGTIHGRLDEINAQVERTKAALIAEASALDVDPLPKGAAASAKSLQQRWKDAGHGRRGRDEAQWKAFRAAIDGVFKRLDAARTERIERDHATRAEADALCAAMEAMAAAPHSSPAEAARLRDAWHGLGTVEVALQRRFEAANAAFDQALRNRARAVREARFHAWREREALCRHAEAGGESAEALRARWSVLLPSDIAAIHHQRRFDAALGGALQTVDPQPTAIRERLVQLEVLAGLESPDEDRDLRRDLQIGRLSARLRGADHGGGVEQEFVGLLEEWSSNATVLDPISLQRFDRAFAALVASLP